MSQLTMEQEMEMISDTIDAVRLYVLGLLLCLSCTRFMSTATSEHAIHWLAHHHGPMTPRLLSGGLQTILAADDKNHLAQLGLGENSRSPVKQDPLLTRSTNFLPILYGPDPDPLLSERWAGVQFTPSDPDDLWQVHNGTHLAPWQIEEGTGVDHRAVQELESKMDMVLTKQVELDNKQDTVDRPCPPPPLTLPRPCAYATRAYLACAHVLAGTLGT
jgi:hypothetical protein